MKKYQSYIGNIQKPQEELNTIIEQFMDDKLKNFYVS